VEKKYKILGKVMYLVQTIIFITFLYGFIKAYNEKMIPILAMFIYFAVMHNLITPLPRYRIPIEWVMLIFSSYGVLEIYRRCSLGGDS
jgi:membrane protein YdbS with pleckstrin-like domain